MRCDRAWLVSGLSTPLEERMVSPALPFVMPLAAAFLYAIASLFLKRALGEGASGLMRLQLVLNWMVALLVAPYAVLAADGPLDLNLWWMPVIAGVVGFLGGFANLLALRFGDVSVVTPLLGVKVVLVALIGVLAFGEVVPVYTWFGVVCTVVGVYLLGRSQSAATGRKLTTLLLAILSSACFALFDLLVMAWGARFGPAPFVGCIMGVVALCSLGLWPFFRAPLIATPRRQLVWTGYSAVFYAAQFLLMLLTLAQFGAATVTNILYSSRGLWAIVLVLALGPLFGNRERSQGAGLMGRRILGALLLLAAIVLVVL